MEIALLMSLKASLYQTRLIVVTPLPALKLQYCEVAVG
jgi:hypothetical protein